MVPIYSQDSFIYGTKMPAQTTYNPKKASDPAALYLPQQGQFLFLIRPELIAARPMTARHPVCGQYFAQGWQLIAHDWLQYPAARPKKAVPTTRLSGVREWSWIA